MHRDHQRWYSHRLNRDMGVAVYGNYGSAHPRLPHQHGRRMGAGRSGHDSHSQPVHRPGANPHFLHQRRAERFVRKQRSAPLPSQLDAGAIRRLYSERSFPVHRLTVPDAGHRDCHARRIARCLSRGQHPLQTSRPREALLRALRHLRHARLDGRDVRRQLLLQ